MISLLNTRNFSLRIIILTIIMLLTNWIFWNYYDVRYFMNWFEILDSYGVTGVYTYAMKSGYMPLVVIILYIFYQAGKFFINFGIVNVNVDILLIKLPVILSSIAVGIILYKREGWRVARWWFYGVPVWVVVYMLQFEPLMVLAMLLGVYALIERKYSIAGLLLGLGASLKYIPAVLLPIIFKLTKDTRQRVNFIFCFLIPIILSSIPFAIFNLSEFLSKTLGFHTERPPQMLSIFNIPFLLWRHNLIIAKVLSIIWIPLALMAYVLAFYKLEVNEGDKYSIFKFIAVLTMIIVVFNKIGNPQYILWFYPFLIYLSEKEGSTKKYAVMFIVVLTLLYPLLLLIPAATLDQPVLVEEDMKFYDAKSLVLNSFTGRFRIYINSVLELFRYYGGESMGYIYSEFPLVGSIIIILYNSVMLYFILSLIGVSASVKRRLNGLIIFIRKI